MGLGILDPKEAVMPGTIQLYDIVEPTDGNANNLKHIPDGLIVLAPQPSDDPNDPLNRPRWRRDFNYALILICSILSLVHGPLLAPVTVTLATEYDKTVGEIAQLTSYSLLSIGGSAYILSILSRLYGKRALFIFAIAILVASDVWAGKATTFALMMGARVLSGIGKAMFEALSLAVIPDLFFPIATHIASEFGLDWAFYGLAISEAIMLLVLFLFFWECAFQRDHDDPLAHMSEHEIPAKV
ncbi:major facilitator superfamily domain-containing protein [Ilyonectria destructans]|nr:major facilitator superfamily domain-containing protein [Ilyonectria destructans]